MTQDEIIEMTRQAGGFDATPEFLERFAKLIAAKEREACAKVCEARAKDFLALYTRYQDEQDNGSEIAATQCARYIRARGEA